MAFHKTAILLALPFALAAGLRAAAPLGALTTVASVRVDNYQTRGAATVIDGSTVETQAYPAEIDLAEGVRIHLYADTRARVYARCLLVEQGGAQLRSAGGYSIVSTSMHVIPTSQSAVIRVQDSSDAVRVGVVAGTAELRQTNGLLVASLNAGGAVNLDRPPDAAAGGPTELTGTLSQKDGRFLLLDDGSGKTVELNGEGLDKAVGRCISVLGSRDPATQIVYLAGFTQIPCGARKAPDPCGAPSSK